MTPLLVMGFGINPTIAVGTDLLYAAITKSSGVFFHQRNGTIHWNIVLLLSLGSIPSALLTLYFLNSARGQGINYDSLIIVTLGIMLILTSIVVSAKNKITAYIHKKNQNHSSFTRALKTYRPHLTVGAGLLLGVLVTISSVGAGAVGTAILLILYPHIRTISIVGSEIAHAVPLTAIGGLGHLNANNVDLSLLIGLLMGGIPAIFVGSWLGKKLPDKFLRPGIALILFTLGVKMILG